MRFDGMNTLEGRHLVLSYASVFLIQGGYFLYLIRGWLKLSPGEEIADSNPKKATRPV